MIVSDADLDRIMSVMSRAFEPAYGEAWTRRQVADALAVGNCHHALVDPAGLVPAPGTPASGFRLSRTAVDEEELLLIAVDPSVRNRGVGRALLDTMARDAAARGARRLLLEMRRGNSAEALYRAFGFVPVGERRGYYRGVSGDRIDAITFAFSLQ